MKFQIKILYNFVSVFFLFQLLSFGVLCHYQYYFPQIGNCCPVPLQRFGKLVRRKAGWQSPRTFDLTKFSNNKSILDPRRKLRESNKTKRDLRFDKLRNLPPPFSQGNANCSEQSFREGRLKESESTSGVQYYRKSLEVAGPGDTWRSISRKRRQSCRRFPASRSFLPSAANQGEGRGMGGG